MIVRVTNLTNGNLSINILRVGLAKGETKDVEMKRKINFTDVDGSTELADLISAGKLTLVVLEEALQGYDSGWVAIGAGATLALTHNLNVDPGRMLIDVLAKTAAGAVHQIHYGMDTTNTGASIGYCVRGVDATTISILRGAGDTECNFVRVRIQVEG